MAARVRFQEELDRRGVSAYRVVQETVGKVAANAVYGLASGQAKRVDLETLGEVAAALERISGAPVAVGDLLEFKPVPPAAVPDLAPLEPDPAGSYEILLERAVKNAKVTPAQGRMPDRVPSRLIGTGPTIAETISESRS